MNKINGKNSGISTAIAAVLLIVGLVVGAGVGYAATSSATKTTTVSSVMTSTVGGGAGQTVTVNQGTTVTQEMTVTQGTTVTQGGGGPKTYTIGSIEPLSGTYAAYGESFLQSVQLAVSQMNANLSAAGNPIQFNVVSADDAGVPSQAASALATMYATYGIHVLIGPLTSGEVTGVLQTADTDHVIVMPPAATATSLEIPRS
jgi:ABC-type branched-subunit amino acid transport system substrate-binding protein